MLDYDKNIDFDGSEYFNAEGKILPEDKNPIFTELGLTSCKKLKDIETKKVIEGFLKKEIAEGIYDIPFLATPILLFIFLFTISCLNFLLYNTIIVSFIGSVTIICIMYCFLCYLRYINYKKLKIEILKEIECRRFLANTLKKYNRIINSNVLDKDNRIFIEKIFLIMNNVFNFRLDFEELADLDFFDAYLTDCLNKSENSTLTGQWLCDRLEKAYLNNTLKQVYPFLTSLGEHPSDMFPTTWNHYLSVNYFASDLKFYLRYSDIKEIRNSKDCFRFILLGSNMIKYKYIGIQDAQIEKSLNDIWDLLQLYKRDIVISPKYQTGG